MFICYILTCLRFLWATAELQDSRLRGPSFQMGNFLFLPGTYQYEYPVLVVEYDGTTLDSKGPITSASVRYGPSSSNTNLQYIFIRLSI